MGVSPVTDTIYHGTVKDDMWQGKKEDVTDIAIKAVFEWFMHQMEKECPDGVYQIRFPSVPYVLEMRKEQITEGGAEGMTEKQEKIKTLAEDYKMVLNEAKSMGCKNIKALYNILLEDMELIVQSLEKQIPKKVKIEQWICTKCDCGFEFSKHHGDGYYSIPLENKTKYCPNCGQAIDWSEKE